MSGLQKVNEMLLAATEHASFCHNSRSVAGARTSPGDVEDLHSQSKTRSKVAKRNPSRH